MMKKEEIYQKIGSIIAEINEQYQYFSEDPENLNALELELFSANAHFLSDHIVILQKLTGSLAKALPAIPNNKIYTEAPITNNNQPKEDFIHFQVTEILEEKDQTSEEKQSDSKHLEAFELEYQPIGQLVDQSVVFYEPVILDNPVNNQKDAPIKITTEKVLETEEQTDLLASTEPSIKEVTLSERAIPTENVSQLAANIPVPTINELLSEKVLQKTLANQFSHQPVHDLKSIINLNDKLLFVKDLFNGYSLAYSEAIELVNRFDNLEAADNFLKINYSAKNHWPEKETTVKKFYEILSRRFTI